MTAQRDDRSAPEVDRRLRELLSPGPAAVARVEAAALAAKGRPASQLRRSVAIGAGAAALLLIVVIVRSALVPRHENVPRVFSSGNLVVAVAPGQPIWIVSRDATITTGKAAVAVVKGEAK